MADSSKCYICKKSLKYEYPVEIIIHLKAKTFLRSVLRLFVSHVDEFVCLECLEKGIVFKEERLEGRK